MSNCFPLLFPSVLPAAPRLSLAQEQVMSQPALPPSCALQRLRDGVLDGLKAGQVAAVCSQNRVRSRPSTTLLHCRLNLAQKTAKLYEDGSAVIVRAKDRLQEVRAGRKKRPESSMGGARRCRCARAPQGQRVWRRASGLGTAPAPSGGGWIADDGVRARRRRCMLRCAALARCPETPRRSMMRRLLPPASTHLHAPHLAWPAALLLTCAALLLRHRSCQTLCGKCAGDGTEQRRACLRLASCAPVTPPPAPQRGPP